MPVADMRAILMRQKGITTYSLPETYFQCVESHNCLAQEGCDTSEVSLCYLKTVHEHELPICRTNSEIINKTQRMRLTHISLGREGKMRFAEEIRSRTLVTLHTAGLVDR